jgi:uncharacterized protein (DUF427 family)
MSFAARKGTKLNIHTFPRPPALELCGRHLTVKLNGRTIADCPSGAYWVLETHHVPTYYIPPTAIDMTAFKKNARSTYCEWKGVANYYDVATPDGIINSRCWTYFNPTDRFKPIKGFISFYAEPFECFVDGERVIPQPGGMSFVSAD